jgi:recombination DNA repair RAD52 pathway protein
MAVKQRALEKFNEPVGKLTPSATLMTTLDQHSARENTGDKENTFRQNRGIFCRQLSQTGSTFQNMTEVKDEILLLKERLDLCELKNKDFEARLQKIRPDSTKPSLTEVAIVEERLI